MEIIQLDKFVKEPLVSVVIPSYNRANTVGQTIDSIIAQERDFEIEIIIGDDCSQDSARDVLLNYQRTYPKQVKLLFHEENVGLGANWATCIQHCKGEYICNCDNDDFWHNKQKLQLQVDFMKNNQQCGVLHTDYRVFNRDSKKIVEKKAFITSIGTSLSHSLFSSHFALCNATFMYRKNVIDKYLKLNDYIACRFTLQDWNTWVILAQHTEFCHIPVSTATFGVETESITRPATYEQMEKRLSKERDCYKYVCDECGFEYKESDYTIYINKVLLNLAFQKNDYNKAKEIGYRLSALGAKDKRVQITSSKILFLFYYYLKRLKNRNGRK